MIKIQKSEPDFFLEAKKKVKNPKTSKAWEDENIKKIKPKLKEYIVKEQKNICAYCEKKLRDLDKLSIDHFKKRDFFPNLSLDYFNLFISCNSLRHCEKFKDIYKLKKEEFEFLIHPFFDNPENFFEYFLDGSIVAKNDLNENDKKRAEFTIKVFNLNDESLREDRKKIICAFLYNLDYIQTKEDFEINCFISLLNWLFNNKESLKGNICE